MTIDTDRRRVSNHLDLIRGLAAVAVLVYHVRYKFFLAYGDLPRHDWLTLLFYTATSFGKDAVMVFFVLSGYFISGSIFRDRATGRWSWKRYLVNRLTRLWLVLLPGLLLTLLWDTLGLSLYGSNPVYTGAPRPWEHDYFPVADRFSVTTFFANAVFLQTILAPPFGSNDPLWSLSYEFWYYILFPLGWLAIVRPARPARAAVQVVFFVLLLMAVGTWIATYFPIWLMGTAVCLLPQIPALQRRFPFGVVMTGLLAFCAFVAMTHLTAVIDLFSSSAAGLDYVNGAAFAIVLYILLHDRSPARDDLYSRVSHEIAGCSYTLYVVHISLLIVLRAALLPDAPWPSEPRYLALAVVIAAGVLLYAYAISRVTERNTAAVRDKVLQVFPSS